MVISLPNVAHLDKRIHEAARLGDVFVYFKHEDTPEGALYAQELLERCGGQARAAG